MDSLPSIAVALTDVDDLKPYARNARKHSAEQVEQIIASIDEFGWTNPILEDAGEIVAGHGRWAAATAIYERGGRIKLPNGATIPANTVPTLDCSGWSDERRRAYILADNRIAEGATWDNDLLRAELVFLEEEGAFDIGSIGFTEADLAKLLADPASGNEVENEWAGMPEFNQQDRKAFRSLALHFPDQDAVDKFAALISQKITPKTRFVWFPEIEIERYADKRYTAEEPKDGVVHPAATAQKRKGRTPRSVAPVRQ